MAVDVATSIEPEHPPLPARTWRQWWTQSPAWVRMACWGGGAALVIHVAFFVRLLVGHQEAGELRELRRRNIFFQYVWEKKPERFAFEHWLLAGMYGKSCDNVVDLRLGQSGTDADLELIGRHFRHVKYLNLREASISDSGLLALRNCPSLEWFNVEGTGITSAGLEGLLYCPKLWVLILNHTGVDDKGVKLLSTLPALKALDIRGTRITADARRYYQDFPKLDSVSGESIRSTQRGRTKP